MLDIESYFIIRKAFVVLITASIALIIVYRLQWTEKSHQQEERYKTLLVGYHSYGKQYTRRATADTSDIDISNAKLHAKKLLSLIRNRYELNTSIGSNFFLTTNNIGKKAWDILKYRLALKIMSGGNQSFLMIFGGSSVTAGHDSYYNQSYPYIVKNRMEVMLGLL
eukprot:gene26410-34570_t